MLNAQWERVSKEKPQCFDKVCDWRRVETREKIKLNEPQTANGLKPTIDHDEITYYYYYYCCHHLINLMKRVEINNQCCDAICHRRKTIKSNMWIL